MLQAIPPPPANQFFDLLTRALPALMTSPDSLNEAERQLGQLIDERVVALFKNRAAEQERERYVDTKEASAIIHASADHILKLHKRGELAGRRTPGTRNFFFKVCDLQDWLSANTRPEDEDRKYTKRNSAQGAKK